MRLVGGGSSFNSDIMLDVLRGSGGLGGATAGVGGADCGGAEPYTSWPGPAGILCWSEEGGLEPGGASGGGD